MEIWKKLYSWRAKQRWLVQMILVVVSACVISLLILSLPFDKYCSINNNANKASFLGYILGVVAIMIAILIYRFQTVDTKESLKKLEHMAFSLEKKEAKDIDELINKLFSRDGLSHLLVISRYSAVPGLWLDKHDTVMRTIKDSKINKMRFIGPDCDTLTSFLDGKDKDKRFIFKEGVIQKLDAYNVALDNSIIKANFRKADLTKMGVNAIIIKSKTENAYGSHYETVFFGDPDNHPYKLEDELIHPTIYYAQLSLMPRLWRYELESILTDKIDNDWLKIFYTT